MAVQGFGGLEQLGNQSIGQSIGYGISAQLASEDWDRWKDSLTRGPGYRMQGLENAGINPILAAQGALGIGGAGISPLSKPSGAGGPGSNPEIARAQAKAARAATAKLVAETEGVTFDNVKRGLSAKWWASPEGIATIAEDARNRALPNTIPGAGVRLIDRLGKTLDSAPSASTAKDVNALRIQKMNLPPWAEKAYNAILNSKRPKNAR